MSANQMNALPESEEVEEKVPKKKTLKRKLSDAFSGSDSKGKESKKKRHEKKEKQRKTKSGNRNKSIDNLIYPNKNSASNSASERGTLDKEQSPHSLPCNTSGTALGHNSSGEYSSSVHFMPSFQVVTEHFKKAFARTEQRSPLNLSKTFRSNKESKSTSIDIITNEPIDLSKTKGDRKPVVRSLTDSLQTDNKTSDIEVGLNLCTSTHKRDSNGAENETSVASSASPLQTILTTTNNEMGFRGTICDNEPSVSDQNIKVTNQQTTSSIKAKTKPDIIVSVHGEEPVLASSEPTTITTPTSSYTTRPVITPPASEFCSFQPLSESTKDGFETTESEAVSRSVSRE